MVSFENRICRLVLSFLLVAGSQKVSAQARCHFYNDQFFGYTCELQDALVEYDNFDFVVDTDNHLGTNTDVSVTSLTIANSTTLRYFPSSLLSQFPSIRYLFLEYAGIERLTPGSFDGCHNVTLLHVRHNLFSTVPAGLFDDCQSLIVLDLSDNGIEEIHDDAFVNIPQLLELDINQNYITRIQSGLLRNHESLEVLHLRYNRISEIEDNAFANLFSLSILYLRNNHITEITPEMFGEEIDIVFFSLEANRLTSVPRFPSKAPFIHQIVLANNQITEILIEDFTFSYQNISIIDLSNNQLTSLSSIVFQFFENLDILNVGFNRIQALDYELFDKVPSLYTFYFDRNLCANARFDNIRSRDQTDAIQETFDMCYYHFFEAETTHTCTFVQDANLGYTCEVSDITFQTFRDKFTFTGNHLATELDNSHVTGLRIVNSNFARVPPTIFQVFPNLEFLSLTNSQLSVIEENTFEDCGILKWIDLSGNQIQRLSSNSFHNCDYVTELILDDNRINEIEPCNIFLLNIYQTHRLSLRRNVCIDRDIQSPSGQWLISNYEDMVAQYLNRCFSLWFLFRQQ